MAAQLVFVVQGRGDTRAFFVGSDIPDDAIRGEMMDHSIWPVLAKILLIGIPAAFGITGAVLAANRGRNALFWGVASTLFPICLLIVWYEKPVREISGKFRQCTQCAEWLPWQEETCRYCKTPQPPK